MGCAHRAVHTKQPRARLIHMKALLRPYVYQIQPSGKCLGSGSAEETLASGRLCCQADVSGTLAAFRRCVTTGAASHRKQMLWRSRRGCSAERLGHVLVALLCSKRMSDHHCHCFCTSTAQPSTESVPKCWAPSAQSSALQHCDSRRSCQTSEPVLSISQGPDSPWLAAFCKQ